MEGSGVTGLLVEWSNGDVSALNRLMPLVYEELCGIARRRLRFEGPAHTLQSTAVVHEAYLRLMDQNRVQWRNCAHFFAVAAQMIRRVLLDDARRSRAVKRGGAAVTLKLDEALALSWSRNVDVVALDEALAALAALHGQQARVVELRFFAGLTISETAKALSISTATVQRDWVTARAWLFERLTQSDAAARKR